MVVDFAAFRAGSKKRAVHDDITCIVATIAEDLSEGDSDDDDELVVLPSAL